MQMLFQEDVGKQTPEQVRATFWKSSGEVETEVEPFEGNEENAADEQDSGDGFEDSAVADEVEVGQESRAESQEPETSREYLALDS